LIIIDKYIELIYIGNIGNIGKYKISEAINNIIKNYFALNF